MSVMVRLLLVSLALFWSGMVVANIINRIAPKDSDSYKQIRRAMAYQPAGHTTKFEEAHVLEKGFPIRKIRQTYSDASINVNNLTVVGSSQIVIGHGRSKRDFGTLTKPVVRPIATNDGVVKKHTENAGVQNKTSTLPEIVEESLKLAATPTPKDDQTIVRAKRGIDWASDKWNQWAMSNVNLNIRYNDNSVNVQDIALNGTNFLQIGNNKQTTLSS